MRQALALFLLLASTGWAAAHPHVWITTRSDLVFAPDGKIASVRHRWTFDEAYSAYAVQGLDKNGDGKISSDELAEFAQVSAGSLAEFGYFTSLKAGGTKLKVEAPREARMTHEDGRVTLQLDLPLEKPLANRLVVLEVYDPTFFVEFATAEGDDAVRLDGAPPGCKLTVSRPKPPPAAKAPAGNLSEAFFETLNAASGFGAQFASRATLACP